MANYRAARALMGKGNSERVRERGSSAKKGDNKAAVKKVPTIIDCRHTPTRRSRQKTVDATKTFLA